MKVLVLMSALPYPPDHGSKIRNLKLLERLSVIGQVHLISLCHDTPAADHLEYLRKRCFKLYPIINRRGRMRKLADIARSIFGRRPYIAVANTHPEARRLAERIIRDEQIDIVQINELWMAGNLPAETGGAAVVLDAHNAEALVQEQIAALPRDPVRRVFASLQIGLTKAFEADVAASVDAVLGVSATDCDYFRKLAPRAELVPNGVDRFILPTDARAPVFLFTGSLQYPPNADAVSWMLAEIWPRISAELPEASLEIVARNPPRSLVRTAGARVIFRPFVDEISPCFRTARVMLVPLRAGGGTRLKILEAFTHGLPVVSTTAGADGLAVTEGEHLLIRDDAEGFAAAAISLYRDPATRHRLAEAAAALAESRYLWDEIFERCANTYREILR